MPLPRPLLLALVGAVLLGAAFFATRGMSGTASDSDSSSAPVTPAPEPKAGAPAEPKASPRPTTDVREALKGPAVATSGTFELHLAAKNLDLTAEGSFQSQGLSKMPLFKVDVSARTGGRTLEVGAVSMGERGYIVRGDQALVVEAQGWNALSRARAQQAENGPNTDDFNGYSKKELDSLEFQGRERLDGTRVLHFRGAVDRKEARDDFGDIASLFEKTSLDSPLPGALARSVQGGTIDLWVGAEDQIVRRELYKYNSASGPFELDYSRGDVNRPQRISAPANASTRTPLKAGWDRDSFGLAFSALTVGVLAVEPAEGDSQRQSKPTPKADRQPARRVRTTPAVVNRAVDGRKVVVLFFRQRGADDDAVARSVNAVRSRKGVAVFTLPVGQAPRYTEVGGSNVVRAPTLVIVGRDDTPRLFEGFIDATTLVQAVTDAR